MKLIKNIATHNFVKIKHWCCKIILVGDEGLYKAVIESKVNMVMAIVFILQ